MTRSVMQNILTKTVFALAKLCRLAEDFIRYTLILWATLIAAVLLIDTTDDIVRANLSATDFILTLKATLEISISVSVGFIALRKLVNLNAER